MRVWISVLLFICPLLHAQGQHDLNDIITLNNGKQIQCRVLEINRDGEVVYWNKRRQTQKLKNVASLDYLRKRLNTLLEARKPGMDLDAEWSLVDMADKLRLPNMARVLAYHVLTLDPQHEGAHEFLGHKSVNKSWRWLLDGKPYKYKDFEKKIQTWKTGLTLQSEHYTLHSIVGLRKSIDAIIDLERLYLGWMGKLGGPLEAGEDVLARDPGSMRVHLFNSPDDKGYTGSRSQEEEPMYDASLQFKTRNGGHNLLVTYLSKKDGKPLCSASIRNPHPATIRIPHRVAE